MNYSDAFRAQCPKLDPPYKGDVHIDLTIFYASRRPDLDESLIMDLIQTDPKTKETWVIENDRQVKSRHTYWGLDPLNPRIEISISAFEVPANRLPVKPLKKTKSKTKGISVLEQV